MFVIGYALGLRGNDPFISHITKPTTPITITVSVMKLLQEGPMIPLEHDADCQRTWGKLDPSCKRCRQLLENTESVREHFNRNPPVPRWKRILKPAGERQDGPKPCPTCGRTPDRYLTTQEAARYLGYPFLSFLRAASKGLFGRFNWGPRTTVDQLRFGIHDLDAWAATQRAAETTPILAKRNPQTAALVRRILEVDKSAVERVAEPDPEPETAPGEGYDAGHPRRLHCPDIVWPLGVER